MVWVVGEDKGKEKVSGRQTAGNEIGEGGGIQRRIFHLLPCILNPPPLSVSLSRLFISHP